MEAVIVTGGNGFLGKHLITALLAKGYYVYNVVRQASGAKQENYYELVCNSYEMLCTKDYEIIHPIKIIYHLAWAGTSGKERMNIDLQINNITFSCKMIEFAKKYNINKIVYSGSIMEYECLKNIFNNNEKYGSGGIYSAAKLAGHLFSQFSAKANNIQYIPIIISNIYGVGENSPRFINSLIRKMCTVSSIDLTEGNQLQDFIYVSDAVEMIMQIAEKGKSFKQYYIGNKQQHPLKEFVQRAANCIGYTGTLDFGAIPYQDIPLTYKEFNTHSFYDDFSYRPQVSFEEGIRKLYQEIMEETA